MSDSSWSSLASSRSQTLTDGSQCRRCLQLTVTPLHWKNDSQRYFKQPSIWSLKSLHYPHPSASLPACLTPSLLQMKWFIASSSLLLLRLPHPSPLFSCLMSNNISSHSSPAFLAAALVAAALLLSLPLHLHLPVSHAELLLRFRDACSEDPSRESQYGVHVWPIKKP